MSTNPSVSATSPGAPGARASSRRARPPVGIPTLVLGRAGGAGRGSGTTRPSPAGLPPARRSFPELGEWNEWGAAVLRRSRKPNARRDATPPPPQPRGPRPLRPEGTRRAPGPAAPARVLLSPGVSEPPRHPRPASPGRDPGSGAAPLGSRSLPRPVGAGGGPCTAARARGGRRWRPLAVPQAQPCARALARRARRRRGGSGDQRPRVSRKRGRGRGRAPQRTPGSGDSWEGGAASGSRPRGALPEAAEPGGRAQPRGEPARVRCGRRKRARRPELRCRAPLPGPRGTGVTWGAGLCRPRWLSAAPALIKRPFWRREASSWRGGGRGGGMWARE